MKRYYIFIGIITLFVQSGFSQSEIKIYGSLGDYPGISYEYTSSNKLGFELGASFRSKKADIWHGLQIRDNNLFINGMLKKYRTNKKGQTNFFYGTYLRYWQTYNYAVNAEQLPLPASIQSLLDSNYTVTYAEKTHKISYGLLMGYKFPIGDKITLGINTGVGFSFPFTFWRKEFIYKQPAKVSLIGDDDFGYLNHLSLIGHLSIGYRFGEKLKKKTATNNV